MSNLKLRKLNLYEYFKKMRGRTAFGIVELTVTEIDLVEFADKMKEEGRKELAQKIQSLDTDPKIKLDDDFVYQLRIMLEKEVK